MSTEVVLHSISLYFSESPLFGEPRSMDEDEKQAPSFQLTTAEMGKEVLSARLWDLPDVFRKKLISYSSLYLAEVQKMNRLSDSIRYNFSDGTQISAQEILRHRYHRKVFLDLLPNGQDIAQPFERWPFLQQDRDSFISQQVIELETIMQNLMSRLLAAFRQKRIQLFLQTEKPHQSWFPITSVDFELPKSLLWKLKVLDHEPVTGQFSLSCGDATPWVIFSSCCWNPKKNSLFVYPFQLEERLLRERTSVFSQSIKQGNRDTWSFDVQGDFELKSVLEHLQKRNLPVEIEGEAQEIASSQQWTEIQIEPQGFWSLCHKLRQENGQTLESPGWSHSAQYTIESLAQGWSWVVGLPVKDLTATHGVKREWDTRILKHSGIHHYLLFETLFLALKGSTSDGRKVSSDALVSELHEAIKRFLVPPALLATVENMKLEEMLSKSVLDGFQKWVNRIFEHLKKPEIWLRSAGEFKCYGLFEREASLLLELFLFHISRAGFDDFKKSKWEFFKNLQKGPSLYCVSTKVENDGMLALEFFQTLVPHQYHVFLNQKRIYELEEKDFDFEMDLQTGSSKDQMNWFELNPRFFLRGESVSLESFLHSRRTGGGIIEYQGQYYMIPRKSWPSVQRLEFFWEKLSRGSAIKGKTPKTSELRVPRHQTLELLALRASGVRIRGDEQWHKICYFYDHLGEQDQNFSVPETVKSWLKPYQTYGLQWLLSLYELRLGALLADDMGLGKTLQTLSFFEKLRLQDQLGRVMVVVPSSLVFNWSSEIQKFTPDLPFEIFTSSKQEKILQKLESPKGLVLIVTYGLLMEHINLFQQFKWNVITFDEAQNLKNRTAKRTLMAKSLQASFKIALTGTPMENHYGEFFSIVDLLVPGALGELEDFRKQYINPSLRLLKSDLMDLKLKVKPLLLRRSKKEILNQLPDKQESVVSIAFEEQQKEIYRDIALSYNESIKNALPVDTEGSIQLKMLTALLRLRQACSDPAGLPNVNYEKVPPKIETLVDSLKDLTSNGESALVFTQFLKTLETTVKVLQENQIPVLCLHGGLTAVQRQKVLQEFQEAQVGTVLVMTLKTGGVGLNLTQASYVFHLEPWWNPAVENQATDRAHRLGQKKAVQVFRYIMHESLEEKIEVLKSQKNEKFKALFQDFEDDIDGLPNRTRLSREDFNYLLGIQEQN